MAESKRRLAGILDLGHPLEKIDWARLCDACDRRIIGLLARGGLDHTFAEALRKSLGENNGEVI